MHPLGTSSAVAQKLRPETLQKLFACLSSKCKPEIACSWELSVVGFSWPNMLIARPVTRCVQWNKAQLNLRHYASARFQESERRPNRCSKLQWPITGDSNTLRLLSMRFA